MSEPLLPVVRHLGLVDYEPTWRRMQQFTDKVRGERNGSHEVLPQFRPF